MSTTNAHITLTELFLGYPISLNTSDWRKTNRIVYITLLWIFIALSGEWLRGGGHRLSCQITYQLSTSYRTQGFKCGYGIHSCKTGCSIPPTQGFVYSYTKNTTFMNFKILLGGVNIVYCTSFKRILNFSYNPWILTIICELHLCKFKLNLTYY